MSTEGAIYKCDHCEKITRDSVILCKECYREVSVPVSTIEISYEEVLVLFIAFYLFA
jgi:hypothetical protein